MECKKSAGSWKRSIFGGLGSEGEEEGMPLPLPLPLPLIREPETPTESMEFLSRSWSIPAEEISRALANRPNNHSFVLQNHNYAERLTSSTHSKRISGIGKWFHLHHHHHNHHKDSEHGSLTKKKDRARVENAHMHVSVSVASLSAALATVCAVEDSLSSSKMARAVASAAELLASRCIEMAEQDGAPHLLLTSSVASAVSVATPDHLITLTAAAATALRAEATLSSRLPKDAKKNATISPCDRSFTDIDPSLRAVEDISLPSSCAGDLMLYTTNGLRSKRVSVYINKRSQVKIKLKSKHVGGAFSKKDKWVVYGVSDEIESSEVEKRNRCFGVQTGQGILEFSCTNKAQKQHWVDAIGRLLCQGIRHSSDLTTLH